MKALFLALFGLVGLPSILSAQEAAHIVIMVVEEPDNYDAVNTMRGFAERELKPLGHRISLIVGDNPQKHHFKGLVEALRDADLLMLFSRRRYPPKNQLAAIRAHLDAGKPLLGIRTANHAFIPKPKEVIDDPDLTPWPTFTQEVLGCQNTGYETKGLPYSVSVAEGATNSVLLAGVHASNILGHQSLYKVLPLESDVTPLLVGTAQTEITPPQPIAWTRSYGKNHARIFYTSLGAPEDMLIPDVRTLLLNGVKWTLGKP